MLVCYHSYLYARPPGHAPLQPQQRPRDLISDANPAALVVYWCLRVVYWRLRVMYWCVPMGAAAGRDRCRCLRTAATPGEAGEE